MTAVALHKGNVSWELSGWAPKYFPESLVRDAKGRLKDKIMFGSDYPSIPYERLLREWGDLGFWTRRWSRSSTATPSASSGSDNQLSL
jgi:predicted TIM-barrel fold metal-dependent hydrolase